jgi:hypothetical protein
VLASRSSPPSKSPEIQREAFGVDVMANITHLLAPPPRLVRQTSGMVSIGPTFATLVNLQILRFTPTSNSLGYLLG